MSKKQKTRVVSQAYFIKAPVATVFDALTNPKVLSKWFLKSASLEQRKGGKYRFTAISHNDTQEGEVLEFEKNKRLKIDWTKWATGTVVTFTTKKVGRNTLLTVVHSGFRDDESLLGHYVGWAYYLMNLKSVLEGRRDLRDKRDILVGA